MNDNTLYATLILVVVASAGVATAAYGYVGLYEAAHPECPTEEGAEYAMVEIHNATYAVALDGDGQIPHSDCWMREP